MFYVSVIVATYNPDLSKLCCTLKSILIQKDVKLEIIITDDGSVKNYFEEIEKYFESYGFSDYVLIPHEKNVGTCSNFYDAIKRAKGDYIKLISPGDYLFDEETLKNWLSYNEENGLMISFGKIINYTIENEKAKFLKIKRIPINLKVYSKRKNYMDRKINYVLLGDVPVGAAFICRRSLLTDYYACIAGRIIYAEDALYRLMVLDNIEIGYYADHVVYYEYGSGISTNNQEKWRQKLLKDYDELDRIIGSRNVTSDSFTPIYNRCVHITGWSGFILKTRLLPGYPYWRIRKQLVRAYSDICGSEDYLLSLTDRSDITG